MFIIAPLFIIIKNEIIYMSFSEWMYKLWYIHLMEHYLAVKKKLLLHATTWGNLKGIMLKVVSIQRLRIA